jgi:hypothetical protein
MTRKLAAALALLMLVAVPAQAIDTRELLSLVAMPLAVAAVSEIAGIPQQDFASVLYRLNQANVAPTQFVQIVRYVPAALIAEERRAPTFASFVERETSRGVRGPELVSSIDEHFVTTYDLRPVHEPEVHRTLLVVKKGERYRGYIPQQVVTRLETRPRDPVALALMPLAVAAVSELTGVPAPPLVELVATLNHANIAPAHFVEVMRYVPVVLVDENGYEFVTYVREEVARGVTGSALVTLIERRFPDYGVPRPEIVDLGYRSVDPLYQDRFFPPVVWERVARDVAHPHGGPPGQLKRELGLQTGAEVVHGAARLGERQRGPSDRGVETRAVRGRSGKDSRGKEAAVRQRGQSEPTGGRGKAATGQQNENRGAASGKRGGKKAEAVPGRASGAGPQQSTGDGRGRPPENRGKPPGQMRKIENETAAPPPGGGGNQEKGRGSGNDNRGGKGKGGRG